MSDGIFSALSFRNFSVSYTIASPRFFASTASRRFASSLAWTSASFTIFSTSSLLRPLEAVIVIFCSLPVPRSLAFTFRMPLASRSNVTSICGIPRGAGGIPSRWNFPIVLLSAAILRSPCSTWISTVGWLSEAVLKISLFFVGIVVLRSISGVITPPSVSIPSVSGVTSSSRTSLTSPFSTPPWIAAPTATTSSGFTPL